MNPSSSCRMPLKKYCVTTSKPPLTEKGRACSGSAAGARTPATSSMDVPAAKTANFANRPPMA